MKKTTFTKSFIAILSAATMTALSTTAAFAKEHTGTGDWAGASETGDVNIKFSGAVDPETDESVRVFKVTVAWESLDFTYTMSEWNTTDHVYDGSWDKNLANVTVTNDSNYGIAYTPSWVGGSDATATTNGVTATLSKITSTYVAAPEVGVAASVTDSFTVSVGGIPTTNSNFKLGTVNVAIAPQAAPATP